MLQFELTFNLTPLFSEPRGDESFASLINSRRAWPPSFKRDFTTNLSLQREIALFLLRSAARDACFRYVECQTLVNQSFGPQLLTSIGWVYVCFCLVSSVSF